MFGRAAVPIFTFAILVLKRERAGSSDAVCERLGALLADEAGAPLDVRVGPDNLAEYLHLPAVRAVGGSWMVPRDALGDTTRVTELVARAVSLATTHSRVVAEHGTRIVAVLDGVIDADETLAAPVAS